MELNLLGLVSGTITFLGVWLGHVLVRKLEYQVSSLHLPAAGFVLIGLFLELGSVRSESALLSAGLGLLGITALWDSFELFRQQKRVSAGRAPANPANPRHARLLAQYPAATPLDLLKREPLGRAVSTTEAIRLVSENEAAQ